VGDVTPCPVLSAPPSFVVVDSVSPIVYEKIIEFKLFGNGVYYTNSLILLLTNMLCSNRHRQKGFNSIFLSYKMWAAGWGGDSDGRVHNRRLQQLAQGSPPSLPPALRAGSNDFFSDDGFVLALFGIRRHVVQVNTTERDALLSL